MHPATILRELRHGQSAAARHGLFWLAVGAGITVMVTVMATPAVDGLRGLPGHVLDRPVEDAAPARAAQPRLTMRQKNEARAASVRIAAREIGVRESRSRPNHSPRIVTYRNAVMGAGEDPWMAEPWCADFVSWVWRRAGVPLGFDGLGSDYVPELVGWARFSGRWHAARSGYQPKQGDLVVYRANGSRHGHVGMVVRLHAGRLHTIEGNYRDQVMRRNVKPWGADVTGFIAPV
jgi:hypothetical protein